MEQTKKTQNAEEHPGRILYDTQIRPIVDTPENFGKYCIIDPNSGDYEIDADSVAARKRLRARQPDVIYWGERIGYKACASIGGSSLKFKIEKGE